MSGGGGQETKSTSELPPEFKRVVFGGNGIIPQAQALQRKGELSVTPQFGATSQQALEQQRDFAGQLGTELIPQIQSLFSGFGDQADGIADVATENMREQLERNVIPTIEQGATQAGQFGSSRHGIVEGLARAEAEKNISDKRAEILFAGADRQLGYAPQLAQLLGMPTSILAGVGSAEDQLATAEGEHKFENLLRLSQLTQGFIPGANQTQVTKGGGPSKLAGAAGGALTGAQIGSAVPGVGTATGAVLGGIAGLFAAG